LEQVGIPFEVVVSDVDETIDGPPDYQVRALAIRKAKAVWAMVGGDAVVLAADTLVFVDGVVLGKPSCREDAFNMLKALAGRSHTVYTGVALLRGGEIGEINAFVDSTKVYFRNLTDTEIWAYIDTGEPMDKAGAYGVQDRGALLVHKVEGDYFTVVGLPVAKVASTLRDMGIEVWVQ